MSGHHSTTFVETSEIKLLFHTMVGSQILRNKNISKTQFN